MELHLRWEEDRRLVLVCSGEIGWDAVDLFSRQAEEALHVRQEPQVLVNIEDVGFVTSAGVGALLQLRKIITDRGGRMVIACPAPSIAQLFTTVGLDRHIPMLASLDEARRLLDKAACATSAVS